jgi:methyltransferase (TIGR00027 family)
MDESAHSRTAMATAFLRALHWQIDERPLILDDPMAIRLLPNLQRRYLRRMALLPRTRLRRYRGRFDAIALLRAQIVVRARFAEDALGDARHAGASRFVILGAGLDTYALRQAPPAIDVVEIDHPATQRWKRELLQSAGIAVPPSLAWLAVDFERDELHDRWVQHDGLDFVSWLGTTYYLTRAAISATLATVAAGVRPGSRLVLDYWSDRPDGVAGSLLLWGTRLAVALQNEPIVSLFDPEEIAELAGAAGWRVLENLSPEAQNARYGATRADGLRVPQFAHLMLAERA